MPGSAGGVSTSDKFAIAVRSAITVAHLHVAALARRGNCLPCFPQHVRRRCRCRRWRRPAVHPCQPDRFDTARRRLLVLGELTDQDLPVASCTWPTPRRPRCARSYHRDNWICKRPRPDTRAHIGHAQFKPGRRVKAPQVMTFVAGEPAHPSQSIADRARLANGQKLITCCSAALASRHADHPRSGLGRYVRWRTVPLSSTPRSWDDEYAVTVLDVPLIGQLRQPGAGSTSSAIDDGVVPGVVRDIERAPRPSCRGAS